jgi:hypothetical protein
VAARAPLERAECSRGPVTGQFLTDHQSPAFVPRWGVRRASSGNQGLGGAVGRPLGVGSVLGVGVGRAVAVGVGVGVGVDVAVAVAVAVGVAVGVCVAVAVAVAVGVNVGVGVTVAVGDSNRLAVGEAVGVGVAVAVGVGVGDPPPTAAKISSRPQPYTLFGGPALPHAVLAM